MKQIGIFIISWFLIYIAFKALVGIGVFEMKDSEHTSMFWATILSIAIILLL